MDDEVVQNKRIVCIEGKKPRSARFHHSQGGVGRGRYMEWGMSCEMGFDLISSRDLILKILSHGRGLLPFHGRIF